MKIVEKTFGKYLDYSLCGNRLKFADTVIIDLEKEQRGAESVVDIGFDEHGNLVRHGIQWYAAQVVIPAKRYEIRENGAADEMGFRQITKTAVPLNTDDVILVLWALEV